MGAADPAATPDPKKTERHVGDAAVEGRHADEKAAVVQKEVEAVVDESRRPPPETETTMVSRLQTQRQVPQLQVVTPAGGGDGGAGAGAGASSSVAAYYTTPPPQAALASLNSRNYTNRISLFVFLLHLAAAFFAVGFFVFKAIQGIVVNPGSRTARHERSLLHFWLPPVEGAVALGIVLAFTWQKAVRAWPAAMVGIILWSSFGITMATGALLLCFSLPATIGLGIALIFFSIGTGLYACWVTRRVSFTGKVFTQAVRPVKKFPGLNGPAYLMVAAGFIWILVWCFGVIGALNFHYPGLTIPALVLSLAWTAEVMRNVTNLTVSRVVALYYLRGMQSSVQFSFQRALSFNLGSACLGSLFLPTIEALRIIARGLNLLEGEDEFMFSCAHCCLHVMECIFRYGNSWAFVHIAAYGRGFVVASQSTWPQFEQRQMGPLVDSDITSSVCFLTGVSSGALCTVLASSWAFATHRQYTATVALLAFYVGYLMTRIGMALPQACVACYYVCYAENPGSRLFDQTIPDRLRLIQTGRDPMVPTPRYPHPSAA